MFSDSGSISQPLSCVTQPLSDQIQRNSFSFSPSSRRRRLRLRGNDWLSRILHAISPRGILFWQEEHYSDIFLWRPERVKMCPWGAQMFPAPCYLYHVSWIRFKWLFSIEIFIPNFPSVCEIRDMQWDSNYHEAVVTRCFESFSPQLVLTKSHVSRVNTSEMSRVVTQMGCCCDANGLASSWEVVSSGQWAPPAGLSPIFASPITESKHAHLSSFLFSLPI